MTKGTSLLAEITKIPRCDSAVLNQLADDVGEESFPQLLAVFIEDTRSRCKEMEATDLHERETWRRQLHALKSSAAAYGAMRLHLLCRELESLCGSVSLSSAQKSELVHEIKQTLKLYQDGVIKSK